MASHTCIDFPLPIAEPQPTIPPLGDPDPQLRATTAMHGGVNPAQPPADSRDAEAQRGMLICCFTGCILICVPGENYGDPSGRLWMMYLIEAEKEDKEITESWKGDAEGILVFVSARPFIFYISSI